jgi:hypothetical protein
VPVRDHQRRIEAAARGRAATIAVADQYAGDMLSVIDGIRATGITTLTGIADVLNARDIPTKRGSRSYAATVRNVLKRAVKR